MVFYFCLIIAYTTLDSKKKLCIGGKELSKQLVLYFSVYGSTEQVANTIARKTGADIAKIVPAIPYDSDRTHYHSLAARAKHEQSENLRPAIANFAQMHLEEYDTIYIG